jgi:hypothetical protein
MRRGYGGGATIVDSTAVVTQRYLIPPAALWLVGLAAIVWGVLCITIQLQTTEANIQGLLAIDASRPDLFVFLQPWDLVFSAMPFGERIADITGWIIEIGTGIFIVGYSDAIEVTGSSGWVMQKFWFIVSWILFGYNFASDLKYGSFPGAANANLGHAEFALALSACVTFFPLIGLHFMRKARYQARNIG